MTERLDLDRQLNAYLHARATSQAPDGLLGTALGQIEATGQRPGWLVLDRWLSAQATVRFAWVTRGATRLAIVALLIAIAIAAILIVGSQRRLPPPFGLARPGLIVFVSSGHLFVVNADGTGRRQLTFGPNSDFRPTWSPDGTLIAYKSESAGRSDAMMVVSADGQRQITIADRLSPSDSGQITWAPDSRRLAFAAAPVDPLLSPSHIYVAEANRPGATELGGPGLMGFEPSWSPDGKQIAFKNLDPVDALWLMDADGSHAHRLTKVPGSGWAFWNAQWSPDGTRLSFLAGDDPSYSRIGSPTAHDVWTINADGTDERNISKSAEDEWWPSWSPDGAKIAFVRISPDPEDLGSFVVVNRDGSGADPLKGPNLDGNMPIWAPDGTKLFGFEAFDVKITTSVGKAIIVYDLSGRTPPTTLADANDGTWQRLAK